MQKRGDSESQLSLAMSYLWGSGVGKNTRKGIEWLTKSANQNECHGTIQFSWRIFRWENIKKDQDLANYWYHKSAENGDMTAQFKLGSLYLDGNLGLPQDINKAKAWFKSRRPRLWISATAIGCIMMKNNETTNLINYRFDFNDYLF